MHNIKCDTNPPNSKGNTHEKKSQKESFSCGFYYLGSYKFNINNKRVRKQCL